MRLGTHVKLKDGRTGTVVYNSLIGIGIKWGIHYPNPKDFEGSSGDCVSWEPPENWEWEPDALLREPWDGCERCGFSRDECIGEDYTIFEVE